ncbi:LysE family translocator [Actinomadura nitritigenes]|uniref:LysE family translocator n=1 Tax=Actinomadura nitritigenes TaxID=134602 RepID=UPI003D932DC4
MPTQMLQFLAVVAVLIITPGPDMALVLRNGAKGGAGAAWFTGLGCCVGIAVHAGTAVVGLSALLAATATAFTAVKLAGAAYLVYLGASALWHTRGRRLQGQAEPAAEPSPDAVVPGRGAAFRQGVLSNLLNPKIALLFLTLIPQFIAPDEPRLATTAVLAVTFLLIAAAWWSTFSLLVGALGRALRRPRVRLLLERFTGAVLVALGLRVAMD